MDVSRYEINRQVRMALNRYGVDLARLDYSCIGSTVYLSGELLNSNEGDLSPAVIESLFREIARLSGVRNVQTDLQNWKISADGGSWQITKVKKKSLAVGAPMTQYGGASETAKDVRIDKSEDIADVLKDIQKKNKPEEHQ